MYWAISLLSIQVDASVDTRLIYFNLSVLAQDRDMFKVSIPQIIGLEFNDTKE
jgi:hypothetical protein